MTGLLCSLVRAGRFSAAERLRLKLVADGLPVDPQPEFADVALAILRGRRLSGAPGCKLAEFTTWLHLVPDRERVPGADPLGPLVVELVERACIKKFRPFFAQTALIVAYKGYAPRHFLTLARPMTLHNSEPGPLLHMERYAALYEQRANLPPSPIACFIRSSLIQLFLQRGWPHRSLDLLLAPRTYALPDDIYTLMLDALPSKRKVILKSRNTTISAP